MPEKRSTNPIKRIESIVSDERLICGLSFLPSFQSRGEVSLSGTTVTDGAGSSLSWSLTAKETGLDAMGLRFGVVLRNLLPGRKAITWDAGRWPVRRRVRRFLLLVERTARCPTVRGFVG